MSLFWLNQKTKAIILLSLVTLAILFALPLSGYAEEPAQIPTGSIPTITGTPVKALAVVLDNDQGFVNLRAGPSTPLWLMKSSGCWSPANPSRPWVARRVAIGSR
jgi:hypothetical protein